MQPEGNTEQTKQPSQHINPLTRPIQQPKLVKSPITRPKMPIGSPIPGPPVPTHTPISRLQLHQLVAPFQGLLSTNS